MPAAELPLKGGNGNKGDLLSRALEHALPRKWLGRKGAANRFFSLRFPEKWLDARVSVVYK
jgi:hypothetical protein